MKKTLVVVLLLGLTIGLLWHFGLIKAPTSLTQNNDSEELQLTQYVPADTVLYMGGKMDERMAEFMADYPAFIFGASERAVFHQFKQELVKDGSAEGRFFNFLIDDFNQNVDGGLMSVYQHYGLATGGEYAIYMHGAIPVLNMPVTDPDKLVSLFTAASNASELKFEQSQVGDAKLMSWKLGDGQATVHLAMTATRAIMTISMEQDNEITLKERLAQVAVSNPYTQGVQSIQQQYGYTQDVIGVVQFDKLVSGLLKADDSRLSQDIARYIPEQNYNQIFEQGGALQTCQADVTSLVSAAPRILMGYQSVDISAAELRAKMHSIWEVNNPMVNQALQQMQGHMPAHVLQLDDQLMSIGLALNVSELAPATTALWQAFTEAQFSCEPLIEVQNEAKQVSPMMLGMMTGMAQGLKGIGLTLFDLAMDKDEEQMIKLDAAVTVEAENPANLLSLLQMVPELAAINIPADGSEVVVPVPFPLEKELKAVMQGKHLVVYSGDKGSQVRQQVVSETLEANALGMGGVFNYKNLSDWLMKNQVLSQFNTADETGCMDMYSFMEQMQYMDMDVSYHVSATEKGPEMLMEMVMPKPVKPQFDNDYAGNWKAEYLDETCQWLPAGIEQLQADGTGMYSEKDESGSCELYKNAYTWKRIGAQLVMTEAEVAQSRESCDEEWSQDEPSEPYICELMYVEKDSFMCLYHSQDTEPFIYRYSR